MGEMTTLSFSVFPVSVLYGVGLLSHPSAYILLNRKEYNHRLLTVPSQTYRYQKEE